MRQMRLMFALSPWDRPMQYGQQAADEMRAKEALFKNFFQNVDVVMRQLNAVQHRSKWDVSSLLQLGLIPLTLSPSCLMCQCRANCG